jgi:hypothetical protein
MVENFIEISILKIDGIFTNLMQCVFLERMGICFYRLWDGLFRDVLVCKNTKIAPCNTF